MKKNNTNLTKEDELDSALYSWPPPWIPGQSKPPQKHTKYFRAKKRALRRIYPRIRNIQAGNELWNRIVDEHYADIDFWIYDDEPRPQETEEWKFLNQSILPKILLALERTCNLEQALQKSEKHSQNKSAAALGDINVTWKEFTVRKEVPVSAKFKEFDPA